MNLLQKLYFTHLMWKYGNRELVFLISPYALSKAYLGCLFRMQSSTKQQMLNQGKLRCNFYAMKKSNFIQTYYYTFSINYTIITLN